MRLNEGSLLKSQQKTSSRRGAKRNPSIKADCERGWRMKLEGKLIGGWYRELFNRANFVYVLVNTETLDPGFECLSRDLELRSGAGRSADAAFALNQGGFDHFDFTLRQRRKSVARAHCLPRLAPEPTLVDRERVTVAQNDGSFDDVL